MANSETNPDRSNEVFRTPDSDGKNNLRPPEAAVKAEVELGADGGQTVAVENTTTPETSFVNGFNIDLKPESHVDNNHNGSDEPDDIETLNTRKRVLNQLLDHGTVAPVDEQEDIFKYAES